jgi:uncharacterized membrane protein
MDMYSWMKRPRLLITLLVLGGSIGWLWHALPSFDGTHGSAITGMLIEGRVIRIISEADVPPSAGSRTTRTQELLVHLDEDRDVEVHNDLTPLQAGDRIFINASLYQTLDESFTIVDYQRTEGLLWLALAFALLVVFISRGKGFYALVGTVFTMAVLFGYTIPAILAAHSALTVGWITGALILLGTIYLSHGFSRKSLAALIGIAVTLLVVGLLAQWAIGNLHFTGYADESALYLNMQAEQHIDLVGLVIIGIIIAAIGVLDDVAVTQASTVLELAEAGEKRGMSLFIQAMRVGNDHISAVINTLVLAYVGAALPLVLLLYMSDFPLSFSLGGEPVAEEIVRTLLSSMGLVLAVPLTTAVAVFFVDRRTKN